MLISAEKIFKLGRNHLETILVVIKWKKLIDAKISTGLLINELCSYSQLYTK